MNAGELLEYFKDLPRDKLTYFVRAGYLTPKKVKRGTLNYNEFSERDLLILQRAWSYIVTYGTKASIAFEKAADEVDSSQMRLF